jgi:TrmH family RNA methyltransferase
MAVATGDLDHRNASAPLRERFVRARSNPAAVVLEGFHALKHALRFGAEIEAACTPDRAALLRLAQALAPDICDRLGDLAEEVAPTIFAGLAPVPPATGVLAIAARPEIDPAAVLSNGRAAPIVLLDQPSHPGNLGAVVRVAAAAGAAAVLTTGPRDPWQPAALRGSAGLHFALPVAAIDRLPDTERPLLAIDPDGEPLSAEVTLEGAILAFGSERQGLGRALLARAKRRIAIPMCEGVSSLNLACAVAVVLYARLAAQRAIVNR